MNQTSLSVGPKEFEVKEGNCAIDWQNWMRGFEIYALASGIKKKSEKKNWLLHFAGPKVQQIYFNLPELKKENRGPLLNGYVAYKQNEYEEAVQKLQNYFAPKQNISYERHIFRKMQQEEGERIEPFVMRLRIQANRCNFGDQEDENVKDQITSGCNSELLRRKILERGDKALDEIIKLPRVSEEVYEQQKVFVKDTKQLNSPGSTDICAIATRNFKRAWNNNKPNEERNRNMECSRCGLKGHKSSYEKCPARGKDCSKCGKKDHFARKCFSTGIRRMNYNNENEPPTKKMKYEPVRMLKETETTQATEFDEYDDVFCIFTIDSNANRIWCKIGGVEIQVVIDSGTRYNVVDRETWAELKAKNIITVSRQKQVDIGFTAYGGHSLSFLGMFEANTQIGEQQTMAKFYVANEVGTILLGYETAIKLKVLKLGREVQEVNHVEAKPQGELGKIKGIMIEIPMKENVKPVQQPYRRIPAALEKIVDGKITDMLERGIIEKVNTSKWISPMVITPKPDGDIRINIDMRRVNEGVEREHHPLPTIDDFLTELRSATVLSKLDVKEAFHQIEISPSSREITTFITKKGLFRYKRLMFGLNCAPEIFQRTMEQILKGCNGCLNFIDDIVVHGNTQTQHDERMTNVLKRLKEYNVTLNDKKCQIGVKEIVFLGHHLSAKGVKPTTDKIIAVKQFRAPRTAEETRSFLGLVNYMGKFIPDLATVSEPLRRLTKKDVIFVWEDEQNEAFEKLKFHLTQDYTLGYYDVEDRTQVIADASPVGLGAVLIQFKGAEPRVITYASHSLSKAERKYSQPEKEALALVWAVERFHYYIFGREFELVTDHQSLETIFAPKSKPCARIERWVLRLQSYKFKVVYKPGKTNIADPLSRLLPDELEQERQMEKEDIAYVNWIISQDEPKAIKLQEITDHSMKDKSIQAVKRAMQRGDWSRAEVVSYKNFETELCFAEEILLRNTRIVMPESLYDRAMQLTHEGHPGMSVMKKRLRAKVWWPKMDDHIEKFVKKCMGCTMVSAPSVPEPMTRKELPSAAWQHLAIDFCGPLPSGHHLLVIVDYYSRYIEVEVMNATPDTADTIDRLKTIFARFGIPLSLQSDNGSQFTSQEFENYCNNNNIHLNNGIPYWPQQNGEVERQNRSLVKRLKISQLEKRNWKDDLQDYLLMYRSTPHTVTLKSPAEMMYNRKIRDKLPSLQEAIVNNDEAVRERDKEMKDKGKEYGDKMRHAKPNDIQEGEEVILKRQKKTNKLSTTFEPQPFKVIKRNGSEITVENPETSTKYRRNVSHVKKIPNGGFRISAPDNTQVHGQVKPLESQVCKRNGKDNQNKEERKEGESPANHPPVKRIRATPKWHADFEINKQNKKGK